MDTSASLTVNPKIRDAQSARNELTALVKNPPTTPVDAIKKYADLTGISGSVTASLGKIIPGLDTVLPALSGLLDLFGSSGPSMAEITLDAITEGFNQVTKQLDNLQKAVDEKIDVSRALTISGILQGVDAVARETVALDVFSAINETNSLIESDIKKLEMYTEYANELKAMTEKTYADISTMVNAAREKADMEFQAMALQIQNMVFSLSGDMIGALNSYLGDAPKPENIRTTESDFAPIVETSARVIDDSGKSNSVVLIGLGVAAVAAYIAAKSKKR